MMEQSVSLFKVRPHVIVATPGRLADHLEHTKGFTLRNLKFLVSDRKAFCLMFSYRPNAEIV